jgi:hypothetical protein
VSTIVFDFENAIDTNTDNVYDICITTTDDGTPNFSYDETFAITITDVDEVAPVITIID